MNPTSFCREYSVEKFSARRCLAPYGYTGRVRRQCAQTSEGSGPVSGGTRPSIGYRPDLYQLLGTQDLCCRNRCRRPDCFRSGCGSGRPAQKTFKTCQQEKTLRKALCSFGNSCVCRLFHLCGPLIQAALQSFHWKPCSGSNNSPRRRAAEQRKTVSI